jgi:lysophospholipase L1-like esterase
VKRVGTLRRPLRPFSPRSFSGLLGWWRFNEGAGLTVYDRANGNHLTLGHPSVPSDPTYQPIWGTGGLDYSGSKMSWAPSQAAVGAKTVIIAYRPTLPSVSQQILMGINTGGPFIVVDAVNGRPIYAIDGRGDPISGPARAISTQQALAFGVVDDGRASYYLNGQRGTLDWYTASPTTPWSTTLGGNLWVGSAFQGTQALQGSLYQLLVYNQPRSAGEMAQLQGWLTDEMKARGITFSYSVPTSGRLLIAVGDSITRGFNVTTGGFVSKLVGQLTQTYTINNLGIGGFGAQSLIDNAAPIDTRFAEIAGQPHCLVVMIGTNAGFSAGEYTLLLNYCTTRKAANAGIKIVVITGTPRSPGASEAARQTFNTSIRNQTTPPWDAIADWGNDANMGQAGQYSNTTYYADGLHPTDAGHDVGMSYVKTAVNSLG